MKSLPLDLDDELDAALDAVSLEQGRAKVELVLDLVRKYVEAEKLKRTLQDPALIALYNELAAEDIALAEQGLADYSRGLQSADQS